MSRTLVDRLDYVLTVDDGNSVLSDASMVIADGRIEAIGPAADIAGRYDKSTFDTILNGRGRLAMPGFVDAHVHLSEQLSRSLFPDCMNTRAWVFNWGKPYYAAVNEDDEYLSALVAGIEMIRNGTTCFLDMGAQNDPARIVEAIDKIGIRGVTGRHAADRRPDTIPDFWTPEMVEHHFFPSADAALSALRRCVEALNNSANGRARCWVNIEGKEPCSPELHVGARLLAEELGVGTTYHCASSIEEAQVSEEKYGVWPITRLAEIGALGPNLVIAHAVALQEQEVALLADSGTKVAFCPGTSLKVAKGATKIGLYPELLDAGVTVALGCDGTSAAGSLSLMRQMYLVAGLFKDARIDPTLIPAEQAIRMATIDGARALQWDDEIGSLEPGKRADLILFDLSDVEWVPCHDPVQAVVYSASPRSLSTVMVDGKVLFDGNAITTVDEAALLKEAAARAKTIVARSGLVRGKTPVTTTLYN